VTVANRGSELREALFGGSEIKIVVSALIFSLGVAMIIFDLSAPMTAPLHVFSLTADLIVVCFSCAAVVAECDCLACYAPVRDCNLNAVVMATLDFVWVAKQFYLATIYFLMGAIFVTAAKPLVGDDCL
jgi:hypothetical protein